MIGPVPPLSTDSRLWLVEREVAAIKDSIATWGRSLLLAFLGSLVALGGATWAAAQAYGELHEQAAVTERLLTELRAEVGNIHHELNEAP